MFKNKAWERGSHSCNYQNSLLLKLNMFDALIHFPFIIFSIQLSCCCSCTLFGFILLSYLISFYVPSINVAANKRETSFAGHCFDMTGLKKKKIMIKGLCMVS